MAIFKEFFRNISRDFSLKNVFFLMRNKTLSHHPFYIEHLTKNNHECKLIYMLFCSFQTVKRNMGNQIFTILPNVCPVKKGPKKIPHINEIELLAFPSMKNKFSYGECIENQEFFFTL